MINYSATGKNEFMFSKLKIHLCTFLLRIFSLEYLGVEWMDSNSKVIPGWTALLRFPKSSWWRGVKALIVCYF